MFFPSTLDINNYKMILSTQEQEKEKKLWYSVMSSFGTEFLILVPYKNELARHLQGVLQFFKQND